MTSFVSATLITAVATAFACSGFQLEPEPSGPPVPMTRLRAEPYSFTFYSGLRTSARLVIRDAVSWETIWKEIHGGVRPMPTLPEVDFSREMMVVAAMGERGTGGYGILLERATEDRADGTAISVLSISPGKHCIVTLALTAPVDIAKLPLRAGPVRFYERSETTVC